MKERIPLLIFAVLSLFIVAISAGDVSINSDPCTKEKYQTAEPGSCLDPRAYRLIKVIDQFKENPYKNDFAKKVLDIFEPRVYETIDTVVSHPDYQVPIRIYYPDKSSTKIERQVIMFIHGGGFIYGSIENYDMAVKKFARISGKIIVSVGYRLAPEHPYPAALNDVNAVLDWIIENMDFIGGKGTKVAVMGDSAGANLATVLTLKNRDANKNQILCQILYYPPTTFEDKEFPSRRYFLFDGNREYLLSAELIKKSKESYLTPDVKETNPYVSPLLADLSYGIPPTLIINAQIDPLRDDGKLYAQKLEKYDQDITYIEYPGIIHGFFNFYMVFNESKQSMKEVRDFVNSSVESMLYDPASRVY